MSEELRSKQRRAPWPTQQAKLQERWRMLGAPPSLRATALHDDAHLVRVAGRHSWANLSAARSARRALPANFDFARSGAAQSKCADATRLHRNARLMLTLFRAPRRKFTKAIHAHAPFELCQVAWGSTSNRRTTQHRGNKGMLWLAARAAHFERMGARASMPTIRQNSGTGA